MIRYAVFTVLIFYFAGANALQPIVPPVIDVATRAFHKSVNKTVSRATRPAVDMVFAPFRNESRQEPAAVSTTTTDEVE